MAVTLGRNLGSLKAQGSAERTQENLSKTFERLSSGLRINHPSDDAAGLSVATVLRANSRVAARAVKNINDSVSVLSIADSAIGELTDIVTRIQELAQQSANATYSTSQRTALDREAQALTNEYARIAQETSFNGIKLFDGTLGDGLQIQTGYGTDGSILIRVGGAIGDGSFNTTASWDSGVFRSNGIVASDFNGDGHIDQMSFSNDGIHLRFGDGTGSFGAETIIATGMTTTMNATLVDINNDSIQDAMVVGYDATQGFALTLIGNGDGSFRAAGTYAMEQMSSRSIVTGDLNGDGFLDLLTAGNNDAFAGQVSVRLGNGDGTFGAATSYTNDSSVSFDITVSDLNGDGRLDLITAGRGALGGSATIRLGNGDGTFGAATSYQMQSFQSSGVALNDLNADGALDLIVGGYNNTNGTIAVRLGVGDGTFGSIATYIAAAAHSNATDGLALADMNGDGILDGVLAGTGASSSVGFVSVVLGNGDGSFGAATSFAVGRAQLDVAVADVNEDGVLDFLLAGQSAASDSLNSVLIAETKDGVSSLLPFSLRSALDAQQAIPIVSRALSALTLQRAFIGASQSRLGSALAVTQAIHDASDVAADRIMDADLASETANMLRLEIIQNATMAVLAQANQSPAIAYRLLESVR